MNTFEQRRQIAHYRAAFHDMPVAGPMDGAAYGEYLKSKGIGMILGVVASVVTMGAAAPLLAGTALATQIAGGVMMAGGVMSGVGAVTGNKKLMKIGGIMSLAGGIGGLASNALNGAGVGGAFASGSGSEAVSNMANSFMDSASSVSGGLLYGDRVAGAAKAASAADFGKTGLSGDEAGIINRAMEAAPTAADLGAEAATEEFAAGGQSIPGANGGGAMSAATTPDAGTLKLAEEAGAKTASEAAGKIDVVGAERTANAGSQIDPANITNDSTPEWKAKLAADEAAKKAAAGGDTLFGMNKTELMKVGAGLLEKGAAAAFAPNEEQKMQAVTDYYKANTTKLTTENEIQQFKLANAGKQVAMIAANDPQMEQKVAAAAAAGHPVAFIPAIGSGGVTPTSGGANMAAPKAQQVAAQTPVRQGTFA